MRTDYTDVYCTHRAVNTTARVLAIDVQIMFRAGAGPLGDTDPNAHVDPLLAAVDAQITPCPKGPLPVVLR